MVNRNGKSPQNKPKNYLVLVGQYSCNLPEERNNYSKGKKAQEQQQVPRQHRASSKIRLFTHLACCCSKFI